MHVGSYMFILGYTRLIDNSRPSHSLWFRYTMVYSYSGEEIVDPTWMVGYCTSSMMCIWFVVTCQRGRARYPTATGNQTWLGKSSFIDDCPISTKHNETTYVERFPQRRCLGGCPWWASSRAQPTERKASTATSSSSRLLFIIYLRFRLEGKVLQYVPRFGCVMSIYVISYGGEQTHRAKELLVDVQQNLDYRLSAANVQCDAAGTWIRT